MRHLLQAEDSNDIDMGIDLTDYYISVEWDILRVPAVRNEKFYVCCEEPYPDVRFFITLRRKTLFYTVNLIIPCVGISFLSVLVFYLPSDSGEKVSLSISILLSLTVFFLLLVEIIPSTSLTVPLLGKYLLFTMVLVTLSVVVTIAVLNVNFRSPVTHKMAKWVRVVFIQIIPKFLMMERPKRDNGNESDEEGDADGKPPEVILTDLFHVQETDEYDTYCRKRFEEVPGLPPSVAIGPVGPCYDDPLPALPLPGAEDDLFGPSSPGYVHEDVSPTFEKPLLREVEKTVDDARFIAQHAKNKDKFENVSNSTFFLRRKIIEKLRILMIINFTDFFSS